MTRKDLNLSLDNNLMGQRHAPDPKPSRFSAAPAGQKQGTYAKAKPQAPRRNIPALTIAIIAVTNMVFLLLAGLWLSTLPYANSAANRSTTPNTTPQMELMLVETHQRLEAVELQLEELAETLKNQKLAAVDRIEGAEEPEPEATLKNASSGAVSTKELNTPVDNWYVNLGTFTNEHAAANVQSQLLSMGRRSDIAQILEGGSNVFELRLSGFGGRELAEMAAGEIMAQTDLNGLSVWQTEHSQQ